MLLRKNTEFLRATVSQEIRQILGPEQGADSDTYRRVQLLIPASPQVMVTHIENADVVAGLNRSYKLPLVPPGASVTFHLTPGQGLYASAEFGFAELSLIVEYRKD